MIYLVSSTKEEVRERLAGVVLQCARDHCGSLPIKSGICWTTDCECNAFCNRQSLTIARRQPSQMRASALLAQSYRETIATTGQSARSKSASLRAFIQVFRRPLFLPDCLAPSFARDTREWAPKLNPFNSSCKNSIFPAYL